MVWELERQPRMVGNTCSSRWGDKLDDMMKAKPWIAPTNDDASSSSNDDGGDGGGEGGGGDREGGDGEGQGQGQGQGTYTPTGYDFPFLPARFDHLNNDRLAARSRRRGRRRPGRGPRWRGFDSDDDNDEFYRWDDIDDWRRRPGGWGWRGRWRNTRRSSPPFGYWSDPGHFPYQARFRHHRDDRHRHAGRRRRRISVPHLRRFDFSFLPRTRNRNDDSYDPWLGSVSELGWPGRARTMRRNRLGDDSNPIDLPSGYSDDGYGDDVRRRLDRDRLGVGGGRWRFDGRSDRTRSGDEWERDRFKDDHRHYAGDDCRMNLPAGWRRERGLREGVPIPAQGLRPGARFIPNGGINRRTRPQYLRPTYQNQHQHQHQQPYPYPSYPIRNSFNHPMPTRTRTGLSPHRQAPYHNQNYNQNHNITNSHEPFLPNPFLRSQPPFQPNLSFPSSYQRPYPSPHHGDGTRPPTHFRSQSRFPAHPPPPPEFFNTNIHSNIDPNPNLTATQGERYGPQQSSYQYPQHYYHHPGPIPRDHQSQNRYPSRLPPTMLGRSEGLTGFPDPPSVVPVPPHRPDYQSHAQGLNILNDGYSHQYPQDPHQRDHRENGNDVGGGDGYDEEEDVFILTRPREPRPYHNTFEGDNRIRDYLSDVGVRPRQSSSYTLANPRFRPPSPYYDYSRTPPPVRTVYRPPRTDTALDRSVPIRSTATRRPTTDFQIPLFRVVPPTPPTRINQPPSHSLPYPLRSGTVPPRSPAPPGRSTWAMDPNRFRPEEVLFDDDDDDDYGDTASEEEEARALDWEYRRRYRDQQQERPHDFSPRSRSHSRFRSGLSYDDDDYGYNYAGGRENLGRDEAYGHRHRHEGGNHERDYGGGYNTRGRRVTDETLSTQATPGLGSEGGRGDGGYGHWWGEGRRGGW